MRVGIVGTGIMGHGMARNFAAHGHEVRVWNRSPSKLDDLVAAGTLRCSTPGELAAASELVFDVVSDDGASRAVQFGEDGVLAGAHPGTTVVVSGTLSLPYVDELAAATREAGLDFLDMPLTGSRPGAESGQLTLLTGGDAAVLSRVRPALDAIAKQIFHFGPIGAGMRFKLLLNGLMAIHASAAAQAAELARKAGLDPVEVGRAIVEGNLNPASPATAALFASLEQAPHQVRFSVEWLEKDLRYAQQMAAGNGVAFDLLDDAQAAFARLVEQGEGDKDWTAIRSLYR